jgi:hypothetical protein
MVGQGVALTWASTVGIIPGFSEENPFHGLRHRNAGNCGTVLIAIMFLADSCCESVVTLQSFFAAELIAVAPYEVKVLVSGTKFPIDRRQHVFVGVEVRQHVLDQHRIILGKVNQSVVFLLHDISISLPT